MNLRSTVLWVVTYFLNGRNVLINGVSSRSPTTKNLSLRNDVYRTGVSWKSLDRTLRD